jgi:hypothetical protein
MGFGVPTEAELKAETTEAKVNRVTNLSTAFNSFLRKQITKQYEYYILSAGYGYSCKVFNP